jgi:hypothetical protein
MKLTRLSKSGLLLIGFGFLICVGYAIWLRNAQTNVAEIRGPMRLEAHNNSYYPLGFLLCLIGSVLFFSCVSQGKIQAVQTT